MRRKQHRDKGEGEGSTTKEAENQVPPERRLGKQHNPQAQRVKAAAPRRRREGRKKQHSKVCVGESSTTKKLKGTAAPRRGEGGRQHPKGEVKNSGGDGTGDTKDPPWSSSTL